MNTERSSGRYVIRRRLARRTVVLASLQPRPRSGGDLELLQLDDVRSLRGIVEVAERHRVSGYVYRMLRTGQVADATIMAPLRRATMRATAMHMRAVTELARLGDMFADVGISWAVLKGPVLAAYHHQHPHLRSYADLDVLIHGSDMRLAVAALEARGATVHPAAWQMALHDGWGEVPVVLPSGLPLDLHWHFLNRQTQRKQFTVDIAGALSRLRHVDVDGLTVPSLDPVDTLTHLCLHATTSGGNRLLWLKDIERVLHTDPPAWGPFLDRAQDWGISLPAAVMLDRSRALVGARVPEVVIQCLATSRAWLAMGRAVRQVVPPEAWHGGASLDRMVTRATRGDGPTSARELLTRGVYALFAERFLDSDREDGSFGTGIVGASSQRDHYLRAVERVAG